jgi:uncharacterized protein YidB (DUF937 family)
MNDSPQPHETSQITDSIEDSVGSPTKGDQVSSTQAALMQIVLCKIEEGELDLRTLIDRFNASGMWDKTSSWVGKGENVKLISQEVERVLGPNDLERISKEAGMPSNEVSEELAELLPKIVDKFSPGGVMPENATIKEAAGLVKSKVD